jgi:hypothetical protein
MFLTFPPLYRDPGNDLQFPEQKREERLLSETKEQELAVIAAAALLPPS